MIFDSSVPLKSIGHDNDFKMTAAVARTGMAGMQVTLVFNQ